MPCVACAQCTCSCIHTCLRCRRGGGGGGRRRRGGPLGLDGLGHGSRLLRTRVRPVLRPGLCPNGLRRPGAVSGAVLDLHPAVHRAGVGVGLSGPPGCKHTVHRHRLPQPASACLSLPPTTAYAARGAVCCLTRSACPTDCCPSVLLALPLSPRLASDTYASSPSPSTLLSCAGFQARCIRPNRKRILLPAEQINA